MKKNLLLVVLLFLGFMLASCNSDETETNLFEREDVELTFNVTSGAQTNEAGTGWTGGGRMEVTKTFKTNPSVVATFSFDALDILNTVGIENTSILKIGVAKNSLPSYLNEFNTNDVENIGTLFIPDWDKLALFMPDLIIIGSRAAGAYDELAKLYPYADILDVTIENGQYEESLRRNAINLGKIFPSVKDEIESEVNEIFDEIGIISNIAKDKEALFIMVSGESLSFYGPVGRFAMIHDEFGFKAADPLASEGGSHGNVVGYEYVASVNPEILFLIDRGVATGGASTISQVLQNQLIKNTKAGQNDDIYILDPIAWYISTGGFESTRQMILDLNSFVEKNS